MELLVYRTSTGLWSLCSDEKLTIFRAKKWPSMTSGGEKMTRRLFDDRWYDGWNRIEEIYQIGVMWQSIKINFDDINLRTTSLLAPLNINYNSLTTLRCVWRYVKHPIGPMKHHAPPYSASWYSIMPNVLQTVPEDTRILLTTPVPGPADHQTISITDNNYWSRQTSCRPGGTDTWWYSMIWLKFCRQTTVHRPTIIIITESSVRQDVYITIATILTNTA